MSQSGKLRIGTPNPEIETLTASVGGVVGPDAAFNLDLLGGANITTTGNPAGNSITFAVDDPPAFTGITLTGFTPTEVVFIGAASELVTSANLTFVDGTSTLTITNGGIADLITMTDAGGTIDVQINTSGDTFYNGGDFGIGLTNPTAKLEVTGDICHTPSATQTIVAGTGITTAMLDANAIIRIDGTGGVTITATPNIADGIDGQIVTFQGTDDVNTVTFQSVSSLANSGLWLAGGANFTLGQGDILQLTYDAGDDLWYEITRSNNQA